MKIHFINKVDKVIFDSGFDKNNLKVVKEKVWKKIRYGQLSNLDSMLFSYISSKSIKWIKWI